MTTAAASEASVVVVVVEVRGCIVKRRCRAISSSLCPLSFLRCVRCALASSTCGAARLVQRRLSGFLRLCRIERDERDEKGGNDVVRSQTRRICRSIAVVRFLPTIAFSSRPCPRPLPPLAAFAEASQEIRVLLGNGSTNLAGNRSVDRVVSTAPDRIRVHADPRRLFSSWRAHRLSVSSDAPRKHVRRLYAGTARDFKLDE